MESTYDLMLILDPEAADDQRQRVLTQVEQILSKTAGEIVSRQEWGQRAMAYEIRHQANGEYHLLQFRAGREALETLDHDLRITDGVIRFRIIKLRAENQLVKGSAAPAPEPEVAEEEPAPAA